MCQRKWQTWYNWLMRNHSDFGYVKPFFVLGITKVILGCNMPGLNYSVFIKCTLQVGSIWITNKQFKKFLISRAKNNHNLKSDSSRWIFLTRHCKGTWCQSYLWHAVDRNFIFILSIISLSCGSHNGGNRSYLRSQSTVNATILKYYSNNMIYHKRLNLRSSDGFHIFISLNSAPLVCQRQSILSDLCPLFGIHLCTRT